MIHSHGSWGLSLLMTSLERGSHSCDLDDQHLNLKGESCKEVSVAGLHMLTAKHCMPW